jgi:3',5'-cyclic AMP phosphodiesterase CpdA
MVHNAGQSIIVSLMRLIHITDPHLSTLDGLGFLAVRGKRRSGYLSWYKKRRYVHRREILDQLTESVASQNPDRVLLTGDLVHIGLEREMKEAATWLRTLGSPGKVILVPGNHDNYASDSLESMHRQWGDYLPERNKGEHDYTSGYPFVHHAGSLKITGVNTSCVTRIFSAAGELGPGQRERLDACFAAAEENLFHCLLIHHPPLPGITYRRKALRDAKELEEIIHRKKPQLVLYGHIHCNREDHLADTRVYCTASASDADNASYRIFDLEQADSGWHCRMRLMTFQEKQFKPAAETVWQAS